MNTVSRLSSTYRATIPAEVRQALGLQAGDDMQFIIKGGKVSICKATGRISEDVLFAAAQTDAMRDWDTPEDDEAFRDL